jgi:hypothetical protein
VLCFSRVRKASKSDYLLRHVCPSVCPHGTHRFPPVIFSWNLVFEYFSKNCGANSRFIESGQKYPALSTQTDTHFWSHLAQFSLEWEIFQTKVVEKIKTHILCSVTFFFKSCHFWANARYIVDPCRPQMTIRHIWTSHHVSIATNIHSEYAILIACPLQQLSH